MFEYFNYFFCCFVLVVSKDAEPSKMIKLEKDIQSSSCPTTKLIDQMMDRTVHHQPA